MKMDKNVALNMAAVAASDSFYVGGNWGFILDTHPDYERILKILNGVDNSVRIIHVSNGLILLVNPTYLQSVISQVEPVTPEILNRHQTRVASESKEFQTLINSIYQGNCRYANRGVNYEEYVIGVYSCNNLHKIRLNGVEYPAYNLTILEALKTLNVLTKYVDIYINVGGHFEDLKNVISNNMINEVYNGMEISNTLTGAFFTIRVVRK